MKVGVPGSGQVAQTLGAGVLARGHEVMLGARDPAKLDDWAAATPGARVGRSPTPPASATSPCWR